MLLAARLTSWGIRCASQTGGTLLGSVGTEQLSSPTGRASECRSLFNAHCGDLVGVVCRPILVPCFKSPSSHRTARAACPMVISSPPPGLRSFVEELYTHVGDDSSEMDNYENENQAAANPVVAAKLKAQLVAFFKTD